MKSALTILGFSLFVFGFISIILSMIGLQISFMRWIDDFGRLNGFIIKILMTFGGVILVYVLRTDTKEME